MQQITTISFFKYSNLKGKIWAFGMMQFAHGYLKKINGLQFYKLMGSGKGLGFNPFPDWSVYSLLQVWDSEEAAMQFFENSSLIKKYKDHSAEQWTLFLKNIKAHGEWAGSNPFVSDKSINDIEGPIVVITRATIKMKYLRTFWKYVPTSEKPLIDNADLIFTKGIGEVPAIQMATFSLWRNIDAIKEFAYRSKEHQKAIQMTRSLGWYKEELFSRFIPFHQLGTWDGVEKEVSSLLQSQS
jgi:hypothetical protein